MARASAKKAAKPTLSEQISKLSVPTMIGIGLVTIVVCVGIFYGLVYMPYDEQSTKIKKTINTLTNDIAKQKTSLQKHKAVAANAEPIAAAYQYIQKFLPHENEMPRLVQMVSEIASRAGLTDGVTLFAPKLPAEVKDNYAEIPFTLTLEGEFLTVLNFLYDFSRMDRIVNVTDVSIGNPKMVDERREIFHVSVKCTGSTYRSLTEEEMKIMAAAAAAPAAKARPRGK